MVARRRVLLIAIASLAVSACGCNLIGAAAYYFGPHRTQKPEFEFPKNSTVAVVFDAARSQYFDPVFIHGFHGRLNDIFRQKKSTSRLVPVEDVMALRTQTGYRDWSVQRIGRELQADYVLFIVIDEMRVKISPDAPVIEPLARLRFKVIKVGEPPDKARVWPPERDGRPVLVTRPPEDAFHSEVADNAMAKLGRQSAWLVSTPFFAHRRAIADLGAGVRYRHRRVQLAGAYPTAAARSSGLARLFRQ
jgi:hypothetical protein